MSTSLPNTLAMTANRARLQVAIDGPAGAGKTTIGRKLAECLQCPVLDTGMMYREVTRRVQLKNEDPHDPKAVVAMADSIHFDLREKSGTWVLFACQEELSTEGLHSDDVERDVSIVAAYPEVRQTLVQRQRSLCDDHAIVMLGRDIGTVVLPEAKVKLFVTAPVGVRAARRHDQWACHHTVTAESTVRSIAIRDQRDETRETSPLRMAPDAVEIDTGSLNIEQSIQRALDIVRSALIPSSKLADG